VPRERSRNLALPILAIMSRVALNPAPLARSNVNVGGGKDSEAR
jgi:hypothetical protein